MSKLLALRRGFAPPRRRLIAAAVLALLTLSGLVAFFTPSPLDSAVSSKASDAVPASPAEAPAASTVKPEPGRASMAPVQRPTVSTSANPSASFDVVHLHRLGRCRGRLVVSRDGVAFVPANEQDDAFTLKYADFVHALSETTLTIKTATKSYHLKALAPGGQDDDGTQLRAIVERIARLRRS